MSDLNRKTRHVALIVEAVEAPRRQMLTGVAQYIQEHEPWALYLKPARVQKSLDSWLEHWKGDGIIAAIDDLNRQLLLDKRLPIVDVAGRVRQPGIPLVHANDRSIGRMGAEHLLERGFRHFGFCVFPGFFWSEDRRDGFVQAVRERGFDCQVFSVEPLPEAGGPQSWEQQQQAMVQFINSLPRPAGVMTSTDLQGQQFLEACLRARVRVPEEIAVLGADNDEPICRITSPPLSSVIINDHQRGYESAALLDRLMSGQPPPEEPIYIEPAGVYARASTDILAIEDQIVVTALRYIRDNACEGINVRDVVRQVPVSRSVLERRFRKLLGSSINDEIVRQRINRAIELLSGTNLELKAIAMKAGFGSQAYMTAVFRSKLDVTPGSYRMPGARRGHPQAMPAATHANALAE
ncbi:XylR family transcriptional regulator [Fontivita pretiosa]|uniref:XylR family transcriptional regulator n=1 Tax=Fontivita pretiosa TaxID=2989684 RepID=UPI003D170045